MRFFFMLCALAPMLASAQVDDDFTDGDFVNNPSWSGEVNKFEIDEAKKLHLQAPAEKDTAYLSTASQAINNAMWEFYVSLDFAPSNSNFTKIYLVSDQADLSKPLHGYFIKIGENLGNDGIDLYRQEGHTETKIIDGPEGQVAESPSVRIRVFRDDTGYWDVLADLEGNNNFNTAIGNIFDDKILINSYFGVSCYYTSSNADGFYFDDFHVTGEAYEDVTPPTISAVVSLSASSLDIYFSEDIDKNTAESVLNYSIDNGIGSPSLAVRDGVNFSLVHLTLPVGLVSQLPYKLSISDVKDLNNNIISPNSSKTFSYVETAPASFRDVVINEIYADFNPSEKLPEAEFVELFNPGTEAYNLSGWFFSDYTKTTVLDSVILFPGDYLILCDEADTSLFSDYGDVLGLTNWPSLNNGADKLEIHNADYQLIDFIIYDDSWYKDEEKGNGGWTLEQINPTLICNNANNWIASIDESGGTPGVQNSNFTVLPDTLAPQLVQVEVSSPTQIRLLFSESVDSSSVFNTNYVVSPLILISNIEIDSINAAAVMLYFSQSLDTGTSYTILIEEIEDCSGNIMPPKSAYFGIGGQPSDYELIITEIMANPIPVLGLPGVEYIEVYNPSDKLISLENVKLANGQNKRMLPVENILPEEYIILCSKTTASAFSPDEKIIGVSGWLSLNNDEDQISLIGKDDKIIFYVNYNKNWYRSADKSDGGWALEMIDLNYACRGEENWTASEDPSGGTPLKINSVNTHKPDLTGPRLLEVIVTDSIHLRLIFDERLDEESVFYAKYSIENELVIDTMQIIYPDLNEVVLRLSQALTGKKSYRITVDYLTDCSGNMIDPDYHITEFALPEQGYHSDIVLNEILFNPKDNGVEFIEIFNRSDKYINLKDWKIGRKAEDTDHMKRISTADLIISPFAFLVFTSDPNQLITDYPLGEEQQFVRINTLPALPNEAGTISLMSNLDSLIDLLDYHEDYHYSILNELKGVSLERINAQALTNDANNWRSAASNVGYATPGYVNSQFSDYKSSDDAVFVEPSVFVPDNTGDIDFTTIYYQFEDADNIANVMVFDARGRKIKTLAANNLLPAKGFYTWDGTNDAGRKVRIGYYLVYFEIFNLEGDVKVYKEKVVVGTRF